MTTTRLSCGCEYDAVEDAIYFNEGFAPGDGCKIPEHRPTPEPPPKGWRTAVIGRGGKPIAKPTAPR